MLKFIKNIIGDKTSADIKEYSPYIRSTNEVFETLENISNDELRERTAGFKARIAEYTSELENEISSLKEQANGTTDIEEKEELFNRIDKLTKDVDQQLEEVLEEILPEAFAVIKETCRRFATEDGLVVTANDFDRDIAAERDSVNINGDKATWSSTWTAAGIEVTWDMVHYDVQLMGGAVLHKGNIAEMATGEGKTLVATLPVYLNALTGKGVHVVTVNNYLAKRDCEWMGPIFEFHGLSIDCIDNHKPNSDERRQAYNADITYGTNNEFGFDYLRDNMAVNPKSLVQRKHHFAIVDEVDSVLIDDARTPLIISGPTPKGDQQEYSELKPKIEKLVAAQRKICQTFLTDAKRDLAIAMDEATDSKTAKEKEKEGGLALLRAHRGLPKNNALIKFLSEPGIKQILLKTEAFYLQDNQKEMPTVDAELFFQIEEKNNAIQLQDKGIDLLAGTGGEADDYILPDVGSKIAEIEKSGRAIEDQVAAKESLMQDYALKAERIHTMNQLLKAYTVFEKDVEYVVMDNKVKIVDEQTGRIMDGRRYSDGLHQAIEAKENVKVEAATQTYATVTLQNYFRMYHKLSGMTGTAETEAKELWDIYELEVMVIPTNRPIARHDREDLVYKTKREKFNAIIDEVVELTEAGRPVLVGTTSVEVSELLSRMLKMKGIKHNVLNAKLHQREAEIVAEAGNPGTVTIATNMAGRGTDIKLSDEVKEAGGLAIIGSERHDSRRVDRQLRGRAGRQGDPGSSQFFVSLEDNLMRLFGSDRIARMMDRLGLKEGEVIQHKMITKSIERAQKKVEENNFGIRKRLLEYDDVMNTQREAIYSKRRNALFGDRLAVDVANMFYDVCENIVSENLEARDYDGFKMDLITTFAMDSPVTESEFEKSNPADLTNTIHNAVWTAYRAKNEALAAQALPVVNNVYENQGAVYENMVFPFSDGKKTMQVVTNLKEAYDSKAATVPGAVEKGVTLAIIDNAWKEHLREMDDLKQSVQHAQYEQKDPLLIYKFESFELFKKMMDEVGKEVIAFLVRCRLPMSMEKVSTTQQGPQNDDLSKAQANKPELAGVQPSGGQPGVAPGQPQQRQPQRVQPVRVDKKVGRNDPCPCGSGKKYKHCHGK